MWSGTQLKSFYRGNVHTTQENFGQVHKRKIYSVDYKDIGEFGWYAYWLKIVLLC